MNFPETRGLFLRLFMPVPGDYLTLTETYLMIALGLLALCTLLIALLLYAEGRRQWTRRISTAEHTTVSYARPVKGGSRTDTGDRG